MTRRITVGLSILAIAIVVGWKLASPSERAARLQDIKLIQSSEHSHPGPSDALAGIRIRLSPSEFDDTILKTTADIPQIALAAE
jgi:hypothetical protein